MSNIPFRKIQVARASENVIEQIEQAIYSDELHPGDKLPPERELAEQFGVSRVTVRDALRVLESNGHLEIKVGAGGGAFIREPNFDPLQHSMSSILKFKKASLLELTEARKIIEIATVNLAAQRATDEDLETLWLAVENAKSGLKSGDSHYMPHSVNFHIAIAKASKNHFLELTVNSFRSMFYNVLEQLLPTKDMAQTAVKDHRELYDAIKAHDGDLAQRLMYEHLTYFENRVNALDPSILDNMES